MQELESKAQNLSETIAEMLPFALYAAVPIVITILIAYFFGTTAQ
jgi:hypothetical protein